MRYPQHALNPTMETQPQARAARVEISHSSPSRAQHGAIRCLGCGKWVYYKWQSSHIRTSGN